MIPSKWTEPSCWCCWWWSEVGEWWEVGCVGSEHYSERSERFQTFWTFRTFRTRSVPNQTCSERILLETCVVFRTFRKRSAIISKQTCRSQTAFSNESKTSFLKNSFRTYFWLVILVQVKDSTESTVKLTHLNRVIWLKSWLIARQLVLDHKMGSVSDDYRCPWCDVIGRGGYSPDGVNTPICTEDRSSCLWKQRGERGCETRADVQSWKLWSYLRLDRLSNSNRALTVLAQHTDDIAKYL